MNDSNMNKTDIKGIFESAMQLYKSEEIDKAKDLFLKITEIQINFDNVDELYYKGMSHIYLAWETTKSIRCFKKILKIGTSNTDFLYDIGMTLYSVSETYNANEFFEKILETETSDVNILFKTGQYLLKMGNLLKAIDCFDKVLDVTNNICDLFDKSTILTSFNLNSIASEYYDKILSLEVSSENKVKEKYYKGLSAYYLLRDEIAKKYFIEVAETENQNTTILFDTANKLYMLNEPSEAYKCLQKSLNLGIIDIVILCGATKLFCNLNKRNETVACIEKILGLQTDDLINLYDLAEFLNSNRSLYATKLYKKILSIEKPNYSTQELYKKAVCEIILKDQNAIKHFEDVLKYELKDINHIFWLNEIARCLLVLKEYKFANNCFQKILNLNDTSNDKNKHVLIIKAFALKVLGKKQDAIKCFEKILKLDVSNINLLYDAGLQLSGMDNKAAQKFFEKISQHSISNFDTNQLYIKGMSEYFLHHEDKAKEYLEKIDVQNSKDTKLVLDIGIAMSNLDEIEFAKSCFDKVFKVIPTSELDYINIGTAYKYLMDLEPQEIEKLKEGAEKNYWEAVKKYNESIFQFNHFSPFLYDFFNNNTHDSNTEEFKNKIYHYTGIDALKGILDNKEFWVTKSDYLNDPSETSYIFDVLKELDLEELDIKNKESFINNFKEQIKDEKKDVYILSMTTEEDSLPMWKNYSNDDGYNIKVDKDKFKNSFVNPGTYILGKVIYINNEERNNKKQYNPIKNLLSAIYKSGQAFKKENHKLNDEIIQKVVFSHIRLISLFVKHTGFEYEHEYRYAFIPQFWLNNKIYESNDRNNNQKIGNYNGIANYYPNFRTNGKGLIPYITIPIYGLTDPDNSVIEKISFSPTLDKDVAKKGLDDYLKLQDLANIDVKPSSIPLRNI